MSSTVVPRSFEKKTGEFGKHRGGSFKSAKSHFATSIHKVDSDFHIDGCHMQM